MGQGVSWLVKTRNSSSKADEHIFCDLLCCHSNKTDKQQMMVSRSADVAAPPINAPHAATGSRNRSPIDGHNRHLVLNLDVNKTVIMTDRVTGKTVEAIVNETLANAAWGMVLDGSWVLQVEKASVERPKGYEGKELLSYAEWVEKANPGSEGKKTRMKLNGSFTARGQPGEVFQSYANQLIANMTRPDGSTVRLIPAFFELLLSLKRQKRSFSICFRTFGEELADVAEELTQFCEGKHPSYPHACMDGSDGEPDYRFSITNAADFGTFHRTDESFALVMGTMDQPGEGKFKDVTERSLSFYKGKPNLQIIEGKFNVYRYLRKRCAKCGTIGIRDYFQYWKSKKMKSEGGKVFFYDPRAKTRSHEVFFDDNLTFTEGYIIQPINMSDVNRKPWVTGLLSSHLVRAEPLLSIGDENYFINEIARLEAGYSVKLRARERLAAVFERLRRQRKLIATLSGLAKNDASGNLSLDEYDAWKNNRRNDSELSLPDPANVSEQDAHLF